MDLLSDIFNSLIQQTWVLHKKYKNLKTIRIHMCLKIPEVFIPENLRFREDICHCAIFLGHILRENNFPSLRLVNPNLTLWSNRLSKFTLILFTWCAWLVIGGRLTLTSLIVPWNCASHAGPAIYTRHEIKLWQAFLGYAWPLPTTRSYKKP